jgi:hypothetical protein
VTVEEVEEIPMAMPTMEEAMTAVARISSVVLLHPPRRRRKIQTKANLMATA